MDEAEKKRLEARGYWVGDYWEFLGLTEAEHQEIELRHSLYYAIKRLKTAKGLSRKALAKLTGATESSVTKLESGTTIGVSLDFMFRAFFALGGQLEDLITPESTRPAEPETPAVPLEPIPKPRRKRLAKQQG
jgi:transcriptional regulator with XRE-family HTH domain